MKRLVIFLFMMSMLSFSLSAEELEYAFERITEDVNVASEVISLNIGNSTYERDIPDDVNELKRLVIGLADMVNYLNENYVLADDRIISELNGIIKQSEDLHTAIRLLRTDGVIMSSKIDSLKEELAKKSWSTWGLGVSSRISLHANTINVLAAASLSIPISDRIMAITDLGIVFPNSPIAFSLGVSFIYKFW